jgi:probable HAF family extracellular repeat protein
LGLKPGSKGKALRNEKENNMKSTSLAIALGMLGLLVLPAGLAAQESSQPRYRVIELGTLGGTYSQSFYVSRNGVASGQASLANGNWHAALWQGTVKRDLGTLGGLNSSAFGSPNAFGQVAGDSETSHSDPNGEDYCGFYASGAPLSGATCRGFLWQDGWMIPLSTLGGHNGAASAINNQGEVAGNAETTTTDSTCPPYDPAQGQYQVLEDKPVVWENGRIKELPTYGGDPDGFAIAINDHGQVVGASGVCSTFNAINGLYLSPVHALLWDHGKVINLGSLGGEFGNQAHNINNRGLVVGASDLAGDAVFHGFVWSQSTGMQDIRPLQGDTYSVALAINDRGEVGGVSIDATFTTLRAFVIVDGVPTDLNTLVPADSSLQLQTVCGINSRGEITGLAVEKKTGQYRGYLAIPVAGANSGR